MLSTEERLGAQL